MIFQHPSTSISTFGNGLCHATRFKPFPTDFGPGRRGCGKGFQAASDLVKRRSGAQGFLMFFDSEHHGFGGQVMNME